MLAAAVAILVLVEIVIAQGPIPQDPSYHAFADQRRLLGVPNLLNVISNAPFLIFGFAGLITVLSRDPSGVLSALRPAYVAFFAGSALAGIGSSTYHLDPDNASLVWDRLPMTVAFMSFFSIVLGEHLSPAVGRKLLPLLLITGLLSVIYWWFTESRGVGDLRLYGLVQFLPMLLIPFIMIFYASRLTKVYLVWTVLATYALAKVFEFYDAPLYERIGLSGHTLKHLAASGGVLFLLIAVRIRAMRDDAARNLRAVTP